MVFSFLQKVSHKIHDLMKSGAHVVSNVTHKVSSVVHKINDVIGNIHNIPIIGSTLEKIVQGALNTPIPEIGLTANMIIGGIEKGSDIVGGIADRVAQDDYSDVKKLGEKAINIGKSAFERFIGNRQ